MDDVDKAIERFYEALEGFYIPEVEFIVWGGYGQHEIASFNNIEDALDFVGDLEIQAMIEGLEIISYDEQGNEICDYSTEI